MLLSSEVSSLVMSVGELRSLGGSSGLRSMGGGGSSGCRGVNGVGGGLSFDSSRGGGVEGFGRRR